MFDGELIMIKCQINVYLILIQDEKILMMKRANTGFRDGMYSLPAGKLEQGETVHQALVREVKEEIGIDISMDTDWLKSTNILHRYSSDGTVAMDFFQRCHEFKGVVENREPEKCDGLIWAPLEAIPANTIPYVKRGVMNSLQGIILDEYIWE